MTRLDGNIHPFRFRFKLGKGGVFVFGRIEGGALSGFSCCKMFVRK